jgi:two-component system sensor histidine kinase KdpD
VDVSTQVQKQMTDDIRPDPDALLARIQKDEERAQHGKLKIFFGMAAGVGKTYAMLDAARQKRAEGVDIVIGYVETHKRVETDALMTGFEVMPRQKLEYRGVTLEEMDIDAILKRKPQVVLVDELAHTNVPGARHPKRYQDVLELLDAGIDVYTTVNVQHFESRADAVQQITGIPIRETVPDTIFEMADEIKLIDIAPDDLLKRLTEGKVYVPDKVGTATQNFFRKGNLTALREMALRLAAERVDHQLQDYMEAKRIAGPWKAAERLMVAVSPSPLSERLVRWTRRMAYTLEAPWIAVNIESSKSLTDEAKAQLMANLMLARELGGEIVTTPGEDLVETLLRVARERNVTQIVVGKPMRNSWQEMLNGGSIVNQLVRESGDIDIYVVRGKEEELSGETPLRRYTSVTMHSQPNQYVIASGIVLGVVALNLVLANWRLGDGKPPLINYQEVALVFMFAILLMGNFLGRGPIFLAAALSAALWDFLFIEPKFTLHMNSFQDVLLVGLYFSAAIITGNLTARLRGQERAMRQREERTLALYRLTRGVANAVTMNDVLRTAVNQVKTVFDCDVAIILGGATGHLVPEAHPVSTYQPSDKDHSVADWAFNNDKPAGRFTDTLTMSEAQYIPLIAPSGTVGILGIRREERLSIDQDILLQTFVSQIALAIEREILDDAARHAAVLQESERLYSTVLDSISHELRTPLAAISGATSSLLNPTISGNESRRAELSETIQESTDRLNRVVNNLLDMTRLESGRLKLNLEWCDVTDLIDVSLKAEEKHLENHDLVIDIAPNLPLVRIDFSLMEQVVVNLLHNAASYSPPGVRIRMIAKLDDKNLLIVVADRGPGIPPELLNRIFEKFYRAPGTAAGGIGLGLSICRGIVELHGGTLTAENRANGGARFTITLPLSKPPELPKEREESEPDSQKQFNNPIVG